MAFLLLKQAKRVQIIVGIVF